jgi:hypothetical protein
MEREHHNRGKRKASSRAPVAKGFSALPGIRQHIVSRIRIQIARGTYVTPGKLEKAVCRLIHDVRRLESLGF